MKKLNPVAAAQELAKATQKWVVYISINCEMKDAILAAPYLNLIEDGQLIMDGGGFILCENEAEATNTFNWTVGDDGPTKFNKYKGTGIYALVIDNTGTCLNENT